MTGTLKMDDDNPYKPTLASPPKTSRNRIQYVVIFVVTLALYAATMRYLSHKFKLTNERARMKAIEFQEQLSK